MLLAMKIDGVDRAFGEVFEVTDPKLIGALLESNSARPLDQPLWRSGRGPVRNWVTDWRQ
jgi:hypothetical protein